MPLRITGMMRVGMMQLALSNESVAMHMWHRRKEASSTTKKCTGTHAATGQLKPTRVTQIQTRSRCKSKHRKLETGINECALTWRLGRTKTSKVMCQCFLFYCRCEVPARTWGSMPLYAFAMICACAPCDWCLCIVVPLHLDLELNSR